MRRFVEAKYIIHNNPVNVFWRTIERDPDTQWMSRNERRIQSKRGVLTDNQSRSILGNQRSLPGRDFECCSQPYFGAAPAMKEQKAADELPPARLRHAFRTIGPNPRSKQLQHGRRAQPRIEAFWKRVDYLLDRGEDILKN